MRPATSHTQTHALTRAHRADTHRNTISCSPPPLRPDCVSQSHTDPARSILKVYCWSAIEAPLTRPALSTSFLLHRLFHSPPLPLSPSQPRISSMHCPSPFPYFPDLLSSPHFPVSLADESKNQPSALKWPRLAPSRPPTRPSSSREREVEVFRKKGVGDEKSHAERRKGTGRGGRGFN